MRFRGDGQRARTGHYVLRARRVASPTGADSTKGLHASCVTGERNARPATRSRPIRLVHGLTVAALLHHYVRRAYWLQPLSWHKAHSPATRATAPAGPELVPPASALPAGRIDRLAILSRWCCPEARCSD